MRFVRFLRPEGDCLVWHGARLPNGYGYFGHNRYAHRFAYEAIFGPIPEGMQVDHLCRNRACVNILHMEIVTHRENTLRGISPAAQQARMTHCFKGHPLEGENLIQKGTLRRCRICRLASKRASYRRTYVPVAERRAD